MKTEEERKEKEFDTVKIFRKIKDKISNDLKEKSFDEIKNYLKKQSSKLWVNQ